MVILLVGLRKWFFSFSLTTRLALVAAILLHLSLLSVFLLRGSPKAYGNESTIANHTISKLDNKSLRQQAVAAQVIDSAKVDRQVAEIRRLRAKKLANERMLLRRLKNSAAKAKKMRQRELASLAKAKMQQKVVAKKIAEAKRQQKLLANKSQKAKAELKLQQQRLAQQQLKAKVNARATGAKNSNHVKAKQESTSKQMSPGQLNYYKNAILSAISHHWSVPATLDKNLSCKLLISLAPSGEVLQVKLLRGSGNSLLDRSARLAVLKASPLPVPKNTGFFKKFKQLQLTVRPEDFSG